MLRHQDEGPPPNAYQMRQEMFSIGDDFWIENGAGQRVYKVDGKALRVRKALVLEDTFGRELYTIQEAMLHVRDTMDIENQAGKIASVHKKLISPLREHFIVEHEAGVDWDVQGKIADHEYTIDGPAGPIAEVGRNWFRVRDTYGISVSPDQDDALVLAVAIVVDAMAHPHR
jgi:uncharacterized protein YxjI